MHLPASLAFYKMYSELCLPVLISDFAQNGGKFLMVGTSSFAVLRRPFFLVRMLGTGSRSGTGPRIGAASEKKGISHGYQRSSEKHMLARNSNNFGHASRHIKWSLLQTCITHTII